MGNVIKSKGIEYRFDVNFSEFSIESNFTALDGRAYDLWIESNLLTGDARSNGNSVDDVIETPAGIIESILRDEIFAERDLVISTKVADDTYTIQNLKYDTDDYYNGAIVYNITRNERMNVIDYDGSTKKITMNTDMFSWSAGDKCFLTNIQGDIKIDIDSFDALNNTTNGLRKNWNFARSIYRDAPATTILTEILNESRLILFTSFNKFKIKAIDEVSGAVDTWTEPLKSQGRYLFKFSLTDLSQLYNDFTVNYNYDEATGQYKNKLYVNKSSNNLTSGATMQSTCRSIFDTYKNINKFEFNADWIKDKTTAELFFTKIFNWYSVQRMIINWSAPVSDFVKYEIGDQVKLNNTKLLPTGVNNNTKFMIYENPIVPIAGAPVINFKLVSMQNA